MENEFKTLHEFYGNHTIVAQKLGITPRHYREIRSSRIEPGVPLKKLIKELARQATSHCEAA